MPSAPRASYRSTWTPVNLIGIVALLVAVGIILWFAADIVMLIFMGILVANLLSFLSGYLRDHTPLSYGWSLAAVILFLLILVGVSLGSAGARIASETDSLTSNLQDSWVLLKQRLGHYEWSKRLISQSEKGYLANIPDGWVGRLTGVFGATLGALSSALLVVFVGIFAAADPGLYRRGMVKLVPLHSRDRAYEVLDEAGVKLRWWFVGQLFSMTVVGTSTAIGLWALGIPFFVTLGILAGVLTFIPNFGPILAAIPAVLLGLTNGPLSALYVVLLYLSVQAIESNLLTPLVQQRNVNLSPVVSVSAQVLMGVLVGLPGLIVAAPLAVLATVLVKRLYIEDTLGDKLEGPAD